MSVEVNVILNGAKAGSLQASEQIFGREFNETMVHQVVVAYLAAGRAGTKAQKTRAEVSGGGAKPWRQKGGGRARAGTTRGPLWRTGGVTFAASPRSYKQKVNRKMFRGAIRAILSELLRQDRLVVSDDVLVSAPKTKELVQRLAHFPEGSKLIVADAIDNNLFLAARNLPGVHVCTSQNLSPAALVGCEHVVVTKAAFQRLEEALQ
ncbi:MAG: 50S ribosomal protein L4 [Methylococcaceae bacterium]|nr:50S ribosomal protein L4 [Methylococcaceae bacterium]